MSKKKKFIGSGKCPKCGYVFAVYKKRTVISEPVKGEYKEELEIR